MSLRDDIAAVIPPTPEEEIAKVQRYLVDWTEANGKPLPPRLMKWHVQQHLSPAALELFHAKYGEFSEQEE